ncbi:hypothetical protein EYF80_057454 [Liparis tanakae]|uniref:Uncharacterized protein n=1 Tax=Liparis tanakae TaxID=230148 RepID=A0A4Z2ETZ8_9TELE|nr:hypothetical protein EYF80_057454 [Liparis tanakae]
MFPQVIGGVTPVTSSRVSTSVTNEGRYHDSHNGPAIHYSGGSSVASPCFLVGGGPGAEAGVQPADWRQTGAEPTTLDDITVTHSAAPRRLTG